MNQDFDFKDYSLEGEEEIILTSDGFSNAEGEDRFLSESGDEFFYNAEGDYFYNARGEKFKGAMKKVGRGIGKGAKAVGKGVVYVAKKVATGFKTFVGKLKPKPGARKLRVEKRKDKRATKGKHIDEIPPVITGPNPETGKVENLKNNPDGTVEVVPQENLKKASNGQTYDKTDLEKSGTTVMQKNETTGVEELIKVLDDNQVETLKTTDGEEISFRKEDLVDKETGKTPMSKGLKIGLIVGGSVLALTVIGLIIYAVRKKKQG